MATSLDNTNGKIAVLGATGNSGLQLVEQALARNYKVVALVRNPEKLTAANLQDKNLEIVQCDIMNPLEVAKHIEGCSAVLSALGHRGMQLSAISFYQDSIKSIVTAMRNANIKRLICMTSFYSKYQPEKYPFIFRILLRPMIGRQLDSMFIMEEYLENDCKDLDYTIVRPPRLMDTPIIEKEVKVCENDYFFPDYSTANRMPRANVARFMLDILKDGKYARQGVAIDMPKMLDQ